MHSQAYYANFEYSIILMPFYVNAFFFVSGFLFFSKQLSLPFQSFGSSSHISQLIKNVFFRLVIPTIHFSSLIYIPKNLFHDNHLNWRVYLYEVFDGISFWFTSALTFVQLVFILLFSLKKKVSDSIFVFPSFFP